MKLATISNLKKYYGDRLILDIDKFEIEEEDKIGIVGENGAGKTTLLKIIIGEIKADEGKVHLRPLISKTFAFKDYLKAYQYIDDNRETTMKVIINVQE